MGLKNNSRATERCKFLSNTVNTEGNGMNVLVKFYSMKYTYREMVCIVNLRFLYRLREETIDLCFKICESGSERQVQREKREREQVRGERWKDRD